MPIWLGPMLGIGLLGIGVFGALWRHDSRAQNTSLLLVANGALVLLLLRPEGAVGATAQALGLLVIAVVVILYALLSQATEAPLADDPPCEEPRDP